MKLLFDQNISFRIKRLIDEKFSDTVHVSDIGLINSGDRQIWEYAKKKNYCIVSFDTDFLSFAVLMGAPPKLIVLRTANRKTNQIAELLLKRHDLIVEFLETETGRCLEIIEEASTV